MVERLRQPGGRLGTWSVVCAVALALIGGALVAALVVRLVTGGTFWSDKDSDVVAGIAFGALGLLGAVGLVIQDRSPWLGAALAIVGGVALALGLFWAVLPLILGIATIAVAVMRGRALSARPQLPDGPAVGTTGG